MAALTGQRRLAAEHDELDFHGVGAADGDAVLAVVLEIDPCARAVDRDGVGGVDGRRDTHVEAAARDAQAQRIRELDLGVAIEIDLGAVGEGQFEAAAFGAEAITGDQRHTALGGFALAVAIEAGEAVDGGDVGGCAGFALGLLLRPGGLDAGLRGLALLVLPDG